MVLTRKNYKNLGISPKEGLFSHVLSRRNKLSNDILLEAGFKIISVPGDGHCLLHSFYKAWKTQISRRNAPSEQDIKSAILTEALIKHEQYAGFHDLPFHTFQKLAKDYVFNKAYNNVFCDLLPLMLSNVFEVNIQIIKEVKSNIQHIEVIPVSGRKPLSVYLYLSRDHYCALGLTEVVKQKSGSCVSDISLENCFSVLQPSEHVPDMYDSDFPPLCIDTVIRKERWEKRKSMKPRPPVLKQINVSSDKGVTHKSNAQINTNKKQEQIAAQSMSISNSFKTIVIGTSHVRGLGLALNSAGVDSVCFTNAGCSLKHITPRIKHMVPLGFNGRVVLQVGGNDLSYLCSESTITEYDRLLSTLYKHAPLCDVHICAIPPRKCSAFNFKRGVLNYYLQLTCFFTQNMFFIDCPDYESTHLKKDGVHLNNTGFSIYVKNMLSSLSQGFRLTLQPQHLK